MVVLILGWPSTWGCIIARFLAVSMSVPAPEAVLVSVPLATSATVADAETSLIVSESGGGKVPEGTNWTAVLLNALG